MNDETAALPDDIETLKALVITQRAALSTRERIIAERDTLIKSIQNELRWEQEKYKSLCARYFGSSSEKSHEAPGQRTFKFNEAEAHASDEPTAIEVIEVAVRRCDTVLPDGESARPIEARSKPSDAVQPGNRRRSGDGYAGYEPVGNRGGVEHVGCFARIRRGFVDARKVNGSDGLADQMIGLIGEVYAIERDLRQRYENGTLSTAEFIEKRKTKLEDIFTQIRLWLSSQSLAVAPSTKRGEAIAYANGHLEKAVRFVEHELLTPDTNRVENAIRPFVVGRKNWEFCATPLGAHASAGIYSLIETAKANGHDAHKYGSSRFRVGKNA